MFTPILAVMGVSITFKIYSQFKKLTLSAHYLTPGNVGYLSPAYLFGLGIFLKDGFLMLSVDNWQKQGFWYWLEAGYISMKNLQAPSGCFFYRISSLQAVKSF